MIGSDFGAAHLFFLVLVGNMNVFTKNKSVREDGFQIFLADSGKTFRLCVTNEEMYFFQI